MSGQYIEIRVAVDGSITAETHNLLGDSCLDHILILEDLLAAETISSIYTSDYYRSRTSHDQQVTDDVQDWQRHTGGV